MKRNPYVHLARRTARVCGFTLVETALVTVIIAVGVVGVVQLLGSGTMANVESAELTMAVNLAGNVQEMLQGATYSTLMATYNNQSYSPPKDARGTNLSSFSNWSQSIDVKYLDPANLTSVLADNNAQDMARVTVTVYHNNLAVYSTSWVAVAP